MKIESWKKGLKNLKGDIINIMERKAKISSIFFFFLAFFAALLFSLLLNEIVFAATCGNGKCESGENCQNCQIDCPNPTCGNGVCESSCGENFSNCATDCGPTCGNGVCESNRGEGPSNCCFDCYEAHYTKKCYDNDVYWYDCNGEIKDKAEECGTSGWTDEYQCSGDGNWVQRKWINRGCSSAPSVQCYSNEEWRDYRDCASEEKTCQNGQCIGLPISVDIKANDSDGPITIPYNTSATLTWISNNASSCVASGDWSGSKPISGFESTGNLTSLKTYTITCSGPGGSASDSVVVNVASPSLSVSLSANPSSGCAPLNNVDLVANVSGTATGSVTYYFDCTNDGTWEMTSSSTETNFVAADLCHYSSSGNFIAKVKVERGNLMAENTTQINVYSCSPSPPPPPIGPFAPPSPTVDLKVNNSDGPLSIPFYSSAILSWFSSGANYCVASNGWSGQKPTSGSESTGNLISSKVYTLTCYGAGGSKSDSVVVNIQQILGAVSPTIQKKARNLSDGQNYYSKSVNADPGEVLEFQIVINSGSGANNVTLKDILPAKISFRPNTLKINGNLISGNITSGVSLGNLSQNQVSTITFLADIAGSDRFNFGATTLTNNATLYFNGGSLSDSVTIVVRKSAVAGASTEVSTGFNLKLIFEILFIPFFVAGLLTLLFKPYIFEFEDWLQLKQIKFRELASKTLLQLKIAQIRIKEKFQ